MPLGLNRTDLNSTGTSYRNGTPINTATHNFGNPIEEPHDFGNPIPSSGTNENVVDWQPNPAHFGNMIGPSVAAPTFISITPNNGSTAGGTSFEIVGTNFVAGAEVTIGGAPATSIVVVDGEHITGVSPAGSAGETDVEIVTTGGSVDTSDAWTYASLPTFLGSITSVNSEYTPNQSTTGGYGPYGTAATSIDTTGASLLVAIMMTRATGTITMADSESNAWTYGTNYAAIGSSTVMTVAYCANPVTSSTHTFNPQSSGGDPACVVFVFGGGSGWTLDTEAGATTSTSGSTVATGSIIPAGAGEIIVAGIGSNSSNAIASINNGFDGGISGQTLGTMLPQYINDSAEPGGGGYLIDNSGASISATFLTNPLNPDWTWVIAAFKQA
jgi:hypothetical protein